jgi:hypothetical protein
MNKKMTQGIILKIVKWLIRYVDGYHVARNGGGKRKITKEEAVWKIN